MAEKKALDREAAKEQPENVFTMCGWLHVGKDFLHVAQLVGAAMFSASEGQEKVDEPYACVRDYEAPNVNPVTVG